MNTFHSSSRTAQVAAILAIVFMCGPLIGVIGTAIAMIQGFDVLSEDPGIAKPEALSSSIGNALIITVIGLIAGVIGLILTLIVLFAMRYREVWFFWTLVGISSIWLLGVPIGSVCGIGLLIVLLVKREEFLKVNNVEQGAAAN